MDFLIFQLLSIYSTLTAAYKVPFCFSSGFTWSSPVTQGVQSVETPGECQLLCADSSICTSVTWYDGQASPHSDYCEMFLVTDQEKEVPCNNCTSGPESCTCSAAYTCSLDGNQLVELIFALTNEIACAELCIQRDECEYYSWYTQENPTLKNVCALLRGCTERTGSTTCNSGPSDCSEADTIGQKYPLCYTVGATWNEDRSGGLANISSPYECQSLCNLEKDCFSFTWFSSIASPYPDFCEFFPEGMSTPTETCTNCVSGRSSCTCSVSDHQTCDTSLEPVLAVLENIKSEVQCQDSCARNSNCSFYSWYSEEGIPLKFICILLESCTQKMDCQGCSSGPKNCDNLYLTLPPECFNYRELSSFTRNVLTEDTNKLCDGSCCCDVLNDAHAPYDWLGEGWYRFVGDAGTQISEEQIGRDLCGTDYTGYMVGGHPSFEDGEVSRTVYFDDGSNHEHYPRNVKVIKCDGFYVYHLVDTQGCCVGYCGK